MAYKDIRDYGIIGDRRTAALVGLDGSIDWLCLPCFDSPSVFAALLDETTGGRLAVTPLDDYASSQEYLDLTNVLTTTFETAEGRVELVDFMVVDGRGRPPAAGPELHRIVRCLSGKMDLALVFEPQPDYGRAPVKITPNEHGVTVRSPAINLALALPFPVEIDEGRVWLRFTVELGDELAFVLSVSDGFPAQPAIRISRQHLDTVGDYWLNWAVRSTYRGPWRPQVLRSALTVKLLTYLDTAAVVAAPTTSLPEKIGGDKNWDYRYMWLRDASLVFGAMFRVGHMADEAVAFFNMIGRTLMANPEKLGIAFGIRGELDLPEFELPGLEGYRGSRPVHIGNRASEQFQLDVYGEVLQTAKLYHQFTRVASEDFLRLVAHLANEICDHWQEPDHGIWEERGEPRQYTHSKVMCELGLRAALDIEKRTGRIGPTQRWEDTRASILEAVLTRAWNEKLGSFVKVFDTDELDASTLLMAVYGFIDADDPRMASTVNVLREKLGRGPFLYRFKWDGEELGRSEGAFVLCSFWLVLYYITLGDLDAAAKLLDKLLPYANHLGLFAEEIDPDTGRFLGNLPQLLVHTDLINGVVLLEQERRHQKLVA